MVDAENASDFISSIWDADVIPRLQEYIEIPNQSPFFDSEWATNGFMDQAVDLLVNWVKKQPVEGLSLEIVRGEGRTPIIFIEVEGSDEVNSTLLMYGHMDKQPPMADGWDEGLGPWTPVIRGEKLYGRGGADDGYSIFTAITSLMVLQRQGIPHARTVMVIEACEESGSKDLPFYMELLKPRVGTPSLIICLDSGAGNYQQLWVTTSLRGVVVGNLRVTLLREGVHSGSASGVVPDTFRIARQLLSRVEDPVTGAVRGHPAFRCHIPATRYAEAEAVADALGDISTMFPFVDGAGAVEVGGDWAEAVLNRTWRPALSITGASGLPPLGNAGNVLRAETALKLSLRVPPLADAPAASKALKSVLEADPPYGAHVAYEEEKAGPGWQAPPQQPWLTAAAACASQAFFGKPACYTGEGGSIPFMGMLSRTYPQAQFLIVGVLGPGSNAHGPNEFIHLGFAKRLTGCVASVVAAHAQQYSSGDGDAAAAAASEESAAGTAATTTTEEEAEGEAEGKQE